MRTLYPEIASNEQWMLARDEPHNLYVEECGNPDGIPVLFVHGGPGAGCDSLHRRFFDPNLYRIILFDQRGCGRSTPHACLTNNTTHHLVEDIDAIRLHLGVSKWLLFGGSWGSTLSLAYAQHYPRHVMGMILRGIFLCRPHEIEWFYQQGASRIHPDYWADFVAPVARADRADMVRAYHELLGSENDITRMKAARAWCQWEARCSHLQSNQAFIDHYDATHAAMAMAQIENHYFCHGSFLADSPLLQNMEPIQDIPGIIVHGRYDIICPLENAVQLHEAWPLSTLNIIPAAGHAATEPGITDALIKATCLFASNHLNGVR